MTDESSYVTVVELDNGLRVRASESVEYVTSFYGQPGPTGMVELADPGDGRRKFVPASRIVLVEVEEEVA